MSTEKEVQQHLYSRPPLDPNAEDSLAKIARRIPHGSTVLDVGCAVGVLGQYLTEQQGCNVDGIEGNAEAAEIARPFYRRIMITDLESADLRQLLEGIRYDRIVCADVLEHLRDPGQLLRQFSDLLTPGGKVIISIPNIAHVGVFLELLSGDFRYRDEGLLDRTHLRFFTRRSFLCFLAENGFSGQVVDRTIVDLQHSEFADIPMETVNPSLLREMQYWDDNITYQFILEAYHQEMGENAKPVPSIDEAASRGPRFACQVFWRSHDEPFTEILSERILLPMGLDRQRVDFALPKGAVEALRFDPSGQKGFLRLYAMRLFDGVDCLWTWDGNIETFLRGTLHAIFPAPLKTGEEGAVLSLLDDDPWLVLPVTKEILSRADHFEVELSWPMSEDYLAVRAEWEDVLKQNQCLSSKLEAIQQSNQKQTDVLPKILQSREEQNQRLSLELKAQKDLVTILKKNLNDLESSRSWRITKPLRVSVQKFRLSAGKFKYLTFRMIRYIYRALPLSLEIKSSIKAKAMPYAHRLIRPSDSSKVPGNANNTSPYYKFPDKDMARHHYQSMLNEFLVTRGRITLPSSLSPQLSVVIILYNQAELTLACLQSLVQYLPEESEVILIDNASTDKTDVLLQLVDGVTIIKNEQNLHFLRACNQARDLAKGEYLLLLNNDAQILPGAVETAITTLAENNNAGAVGGRIINLDGLLQEAGSIIWQDGSCLGYGRGDHPDKPEYRFRRPVDYCSGAFLLTRTTLFQEMGGFDEAFAPAYYEETDYCVRLWEQGYEVLYDPDVILYHFEFGSGGSAHANDLMVSHQTIFTQRHTAYLQNQQPPNTKNVLVARCHSLQPRILYVDDRVPRPRYGSGFPRACRIVHELSQQGLVTLYCTNHAHESWQDIYADIPKEIEVMRGHDASSLHTFLQERTDYYDIIWVSRPHNMTHILRMQKSGLINTKTSIIYDAEALISFREQERAILQKNKPTITLDEEMRLAAAADLVLAVSIAEAEQFQGAGAPQCAVLGHCLQISPTPATFTERSGFLFVGALPSLNSPNADSLFWFSKAVWPLIQQVLGNSVQFNVVGYTPDPTLFDGRLAEGIRLVGTVPDLTPWYNLSRVVVIPTRFAAGIPMKAHDAAAHGVPLIASTLIARQLGWKDEYELLQAPLDAKPFAAACIRLYQEKSLWNMLRQNALQAVCNDADVDRFRATIISSLRSARRVIDPNSTENILTIDP
ncbi:glycosyltransferase [Acidithiobacillus ferrianus]|uniref:glycosyltransferase n=1 Tax=Acidithiobacillus ferrianus TaxID=2678518 RepID=UPI0034E5B28A